MDHLKTIASRQDDPAQLEMALGRPAKLIYVFPWSLNKHFSDSVKQIGKHVFLWFCDMYFSDYVTCISLK